LHDARHARHVTISESDKSTKISEAAFRSPVSGEKQHLKTMWKKEAKCKVDMKMSSAVNTLPEWDDSSAYCTTRRNIYIMMKKVYIDMESAAGKKLADVYPEGCKILITQSREKTLPLSTSWCWGRWSTTRTE